jgi:UDP-N-acetylmuramoylalanine--D-glutamate ligase
MFELQNKRVLVIGLDTPGQAACELLSHQGAKVFAVDPVDMADHGESARKLRALGVEIAPDLTKLPLSGFDLAVVSSALTSGTSLLQSVFQTGTPLISELELGCQQTNCLSIAIGGTNGKATTAELVQRVLANNHRKTLVAGDNTRPLCSVAERSKELDYLILTVNAFELEHTQLFRPTVAVLLNLATDPDYDANTEQYVRANARLFRNQQLFDWAIIQSEALARLQHLELPVPAKTITFSATHPDADLYLDRGLIISRIPNWPGPLLDTDHCQLRGPHNAENLMAALAVGHALRLALESIVDPMKTFTAGPHRFELVAEINGVQYINDSKATNLDALQKALMAARPGPTGEANVWLIAGGSDKDLEFHDVGPLLSKRVKRAFLLGEASEHIRAAWSLFTPCTTAHSLLEAVAEAAKAAASGDVVLLSPACSTFDEFRNYQQRGEVFCGAVKSIGRGAHVATPHINGN